MYGVFLLLWALATAPVRIDLHAAMGMGLLPSGYIRVRVYQLGVRLDWKVEINAGKLDLTLRLTRKRKQRHRRVPDVGARLTRQLALLLRSSALRKNICAYGKSLRVTAFARIGLDEAAATAIVCALVQSVCAALPFVRADVLPEYRGKGFAAQATCIASFRMGTLMYTAALHAKARIARAARMKARRQKSGGKAHGKTPDKLGDANVA